MLSRILFTVGAKGGSGKSTAARFIVTYLREHGIDPLLMELDDENPTLFRFFPEALCVPITRKSSHDVLIEKALDGEHTIILADLKAGTGLEVLDWFEDVPFKGARTPRGPLCLPGFDHQFA
jgi:cellulose biosynthesis protein BcsQ